jgi:hypothetical protein
MSRYLTTAFGIAVLLIASTGLAKERTALESASVKAAMDCVAAAALNDPDIMSLYQENRLKQVTDRIVLHSDVCENPLTAMRLLHDQIHGRGTGGRFLRGDYLADLPRAVRERIGVEIARRIIAARPDVGGSYGTAYPGLSRELLNHNGSIMSLVESSDGSRTIYYQAPRSAMAELGVRPGTLLFQGYDTNGHWLGTAYVFKLGCPPTPYRVEGSLQSNYYGGRYVRLRGPAPFEYIACTPFSYSWDDNSDLVFDYLEPREAE